jgi:hypothetical protein
MHDHQNYTRQPQVRCRRYGFYQKTLDWLRLALELVLVVAWLAYIYDIVRHILTLAQSTGYDSVYAQRRTMRTLAGRESCRRQEITCGTHFLTCHTVAILPHMHTNTRTYANAPCRNKLAFFGVLWNLVDLAYFLLLGASIGVWLYIISDPDVRRLQVTETSITMPNGTPVNFTNTALAGRSLPQDSAGPCFCYNGTHRNNARVHHTHTRTQWKSTSR